MAALLSLSAKRCIICILIVVTLMLLVRESNAYPSPPWMAPSSSSYIFTEESAACKTDVELLDLCQRCAKLTRSRLAYPACCSSDLIARKWCYDFIYFKEKN